MRQVEVFLWYLPPWSRGARPHLSRFKMTAEEAALQGALRPEPASRELRLVPETEHERDMARLRSDTAPSARINAAVFAARPNMLALRVRNVKWLDDYWAPAARVPG